MTRKSSHKFSRSQGYAIPEKYAVSLAECYNSDTVLSKY